MCANVSTFRVVGHISRLESVSILPGQAGDAPYFDFQLFRIGIFYYEATHTFQGSGLEHSDYVAANLETLAPVRCRHLASHMELKGVR